MHETIITPMTEQARQPFARLIPDAATAAQNYKLITVVTSDYDEGGDNSVELSFPWPFRAVDLDSDSVKMAIEKCEKMGEENLAPHVRSQRVREKLFPFLLRMARREMRYFLSGVKMGKNIPGAEGLTSGW